MSKAVLYRQCRLRKGLGEASCSEQVSYIPEPFCRLGRVLRLRDEDGEWSDGWEVVEVSTLAHAEEWVDRQSRAYTKNRAYSDI